MLGLGKRVIFGNKRGGGPVYGGKGRAQVMGDRPEQIAPHALFFAFRAQLLLLPHPQHFLLPDPNVQRAGGNGDYQHNDGGKNAFLHKKIKGVIWVGKREIHREHADNGGNNAAAIPVGFQRNQEYAEYENHGNQRLCGKNLLNQKIDGKGTTENKDRKQNIFLLLATFHSDLSRYISPIIRHGKRHFKNFSRKTGNCAGFFTKSTPQIWYDKKYKTPGPVNDRREKEEDFVEYDSSGDTDNCPDMVCLYMAYLRPLLRYRA